VNTIASCRSGLRRSRRKPGGARRAEQAVADRAAGWSGSRWCWCTAAPHVTSPRVRLSRSHIRAPSRNWPFGPRGGAVLAFPPPLRGRDREGGTANSEIANSPPPHPPPQGGREHEAVPALRGYALRALRAYQCETRCVNAIVWGERSDRRAERDDPGEGASRQSLDLPGPLTRLGASRLADLSPHAGRGKAGPRHRIGEISVSGIRSKSPISSPFR
jgi:hypothetical protein